MIQIFLKQFKIVINSNKVIIILKYNINISECIHKCAIKYKNALSGFSAMLQMPA